MTIPEIKYTSDNTMKYILQKLPEYQDYWEKCLLYWAGDKTTIHTYITDFLHFTKKMIEDKNYSLLSKIFKIIENLVLYGDENVSNAVSLCFLESLINSSGNRPNELPYESYISLLGAESRKVCKDLDEFWGAKTPGLWKEGEIFTPEKWIDTSEKLPEIPKSWKKSC